VARSDGYFVNAADPLVWSEVTAVPVLDARSIPDLSLIVFSNFTDLVAYDARGVRWKSRIGADELRILEASAKRIVGTWWDPSRIASSEFVVDSATGELIAGSRWHLR
jgi:hypothetical protein